MVVSRDKPAGSRDKAAGSHDKAVVLRDRPAGSRDKRGKRQSWYKNCEHLYKMGFMTKVIV